MQPARDQNDAPPSRSGWRRSICITLLTAPVAALVVFAVSVILTSDRTPREFPITAWIAGGKRWADSEQGITFPIGPRPFLLSSAVPPPDVPFSRLEMEFYLRRTLVPQAGLLYRVPSGDGEELRVYDFSRKVRRRGWNRISISADEAAGLGESRSIMLSIVSTGGPNTAGVRNARLRSHSHGERADEMLAALFRHEPLSPASINFVPSQTVAGRGFLFILWMAIPLALLVLLFRRFVLRESIRIPAHLAVTVLALFVLADLRNGVDYYRNARDALARKAESPDEVALLGTLESGFPWFTEAVRFLGERRRIAPGEKYLLHIGGSVFAHQAARRVQYYAYPAQRSFRYRDADVAFVYARPLMPFRAFAQWRHVRSFPSGAQAFERKR